MWLTSTVDPSKRYPRSYHVGGWMAYTELLCRHTGSGRAAVRQEELDGEREPSDFQVQPEVRPKRAQSLPSESLWLSRTRRYIANKLLFPHSLQSQRRRKATSVRRVLRAARSNLGGTDRIKADFRNLCEHLWQFSLPIELFLPHGSSVCRHRAPCKPSSVIGTSVSL